MRAVALTIIAGLAVASANPVISVYISEIQVAPDSLERIELHPWVGPPYVDLTGAWIATQAGTAYVDTGVTIEGESSYVVLDRSNTSGTFSLGDDGDFIKIAIPYADTQRLIYPSNPYRTVGGSWAPPAGFSSAVFQWWEWHGMEQWDFYTWYIDETPTFGSHNDDSIGGVTGTVFSADSQRLEGACVRFSAEFGELEMLTLEYGRYEQEVMGPGAYHMFVNASGYPPWHSPESIRFAVNEGKTIDVYLDPVGVAEPGGSLGPELPRVTWRPGCVALDASATPGVEFAMVDVTGRRVMALQPGNNDLRGVAPGIYFVRSAVGGERSAVAKVVVQR